MRMNPGIVLAGRTPDIIGNMDRGFQAGRRNRLAALYQDHGPGIMQGEANAMNRLAQFDPNAAMQAQSQQLGMNATRQRMDMLSAQERRQIEAHAAKMSAAERAAEAQRVQDGILRATQIYQTGDLGSLNAMLQSVGEQPLQSLDQFPALAGRYGDALTVLKNVRDFQAGPKPVSGPGKVQADISAGFLPEGTPLRSGPLVDQSGPQIGTIPQGFQLVQDGNAYRLDPIPGGPADTTEHDAKARVAKETSANIVLDEISITRDLIQGQSLASPATGIAGGLMSNIDSTRAGAVKNRLETIKANIGFDKLQAMRDASPTGGALGQVSEFENRLLQAVFGSLQQAQRAEDLLYNLERLEVIYNRIVHNGIPDDEARAMYQQIAAGEFSENEAEPDIDALINQYAD